MKAPHNAENLVSSNRTGQSQGHKVTQHSVSRKTDKVASRYNSYTMVKVRGAQGKEKEGAPPPPHAC